MNCFDLTRSNFENDEILLTETRGVEKKASEIFVGWSGAASL